MKNLISNQGHQVVLFHSRYPFKNQRLDNKEVIYSGLTLEAPKELLKGKDNTNINIDGYKYVTIYKTK